MAEEASFPPELERQIFELAALQHPTTIPTLLRRSADNVIRIEPLLYRVLRIDKHDVQMAIQRALESKPPTFFKYVSHVVLSAEYDTKMVSEILALSPNIVDLAIRDYSDYIWSRDPHTFPADLRPQRLILERSFVFHVDLAKPVFFSVTHLTLLLSSALYEEHWDTYSGLGALPALTHLCLSASISGYILLNVLVECRTLSVVVTTWWDARLESGTRTRSRASVDSWTKSWVPSRPDMRVVLMDLHYFYDGWERAAWTGDDLWARVDDFIARKHTGEIQATTYLLDVTDTDPLYEREKPELPRYSQRLV
ncbi:hypothetical protein B0H13DRAFT_2365763 [Mycena leptocephala]|nr:hypothetical protein B0H13DRAFT_2365763 [Mycena leptocephala]